MIRRLHKDTNENGREAFNEMNFDEFLEALGMSKELYINALRASLKRPQILIQREPKDVMINNYNTSIMALHRGNHDMAYILDPYACGSYILGYLTKNETMMSRLLRQVNEDAKSKTGQWIGD